MRRVCLKFFVLAIALLSVAQLYAQVPDPTIAAQAPVPGSGHHYIGTGGETVNPADGSLSFDLPLDPAPGRQISFRFGIRFSGTEQFYLSNNGQATGNVTWYPNWQYGQAPWQVEAWSYDLPILTAQSSLFWTGTTADCPNGVCTYHTNRCYGNDSYVFRGLDGVQYSLPLGTVFPDPNNYQTGFCPAAPNNQKSPGNNHGILSRLLDYSQAPPVQVTDQSGTTYQFPGVGNWQIQGTNTIETIGTRFVTPIPQADFLKNARSDHPTPSPAYPVSVEKKQ